MTLLVIALLISLVANIIAYFTIMNDTRIIDKLVDEIDTITSESKNQRDYLPDEEVYQGIAGGDR